MSRLSPGRPFILKTALCALYLYLLLVPDAVHAKSASGSLGSVWVTEGRFTLSELAAEINNPAVFSYRNGIATLPGTFSLDGDTAELVIGPGETFRLVHVPVPEGEPVPPQQVLDRRIFLTRGKVSWTGCTIEDFYWISVNPAVSGVWDEVTFRVAEDHDNAYEPIQLGSSNIVWQGGMVDTRNCNRTLLPHAPWVIQDTTATLEAVAFRSAGLVLGPLGLSGVDCRFRFLNCIFETGTNRRLFDLQAGASDCSSLRVTVENPVFPSLSNPDPDELVEIHGAAVECSWIQGEERRTVIYKGPEVYYSTESDIFQSLEQDSEIVKQSFNDPALGSLSGLLWWPRQRFETIQRGFRIARVFGRCGITEIESWKASLSQVQSNLTHLPQVRQPGSPYCPQVLPFPILEPGSAAALRHEDGVVELTTAQSHLIYDPRGDKEHFACFTADSRIRGRPLMDTDPVHGAVSIRVTGWNRATTLEGHAVWRTRVTQSGGRIAAMEASHPDGASATIVIFQDLPDVILFDVNSNMVRYQAYGHGGEGRYNGLRFWNDDPAGVRRTFSPEGAIPLSDPRHGVFVAGFSGEWYKSRLARGFVTASFQGLNNWNHSPPCGCLIHPDELDLLWTTCGGDYFSYIVQVNSQFGAGHPNLEDAKETSQVLYVEGAGLGCWENLEALDRAWNHPLCLQPVTLEPDRPCHVMLMEEDGFDRPAEIVLLPRWCDDLQSDQDWYHGAHTVGLLRDIQACQVVKIGYLPLSMKLDEENKWTITNSGIRTIPHVRVMLPQPNTKEFSELRWNGAVAGDVKVASGQLECALDVPVGVSELVMGLAGK